MTDELKILTSPVSADQADSAYQDQVSKEDIERARVHLEQNYFGPGTLSTEYVGDIAVFRDDEGEIVAWITYDGTVSALRDEEYITFHISEIGEVEEEEEISEDWLVWLDQFNEPETNDYTWTPTSGAPTQNSAAKYSNYSQSYTQHLAPCDTLGDSINFDDTIADLENVAEDAVADSREVVSEVSSPVVHVDDSLLAASAEIAVTDPEFALPRSEDSAIAATIPRADVSDVVNQFDKPVENEPQKVSMSSSSDQRSNDSAQRSSAVNISETVIASAVHTVNEGEEGREQASEQALHAASPSASVRLANSDPSAQNPAKEMPSNALTNDAQPIAVAHRGPVLRAPASHGVVVATLQNNGTGSAHSHLTGARALVSDHDPFTAAYAQAGKGGQPNLSHTASPVVLASLHDSSSRDVVLPTRHSDGHNERQGHDQDDRGDDNEYGSFDDVEEELC